MPAKIYGWRDYLYRNNSYDAPLQTQQGQFPAYMVATKLTTINQGTHKTRANVAHHNGSRAYRDGWLRPRVVRSSVVALATR